MTLSPEIAPTLPAALALLAALLLRAVHPRRQGAWGPVSTFASWASLTPLAWTVAHAGALSLGWCALVSGLGVALLARDTGDRLQSEAALKMTWVFGTAFALSWAGWLLLALASGTAAPLEQGSALGLGLDPYALWSTGVSLSLLAGFVLLGAAPFHFWPADVFQGSRAWLAPLVVAALQCTGATWLMVRAADFAAFPAATSQMRALLVMGAGVALLGGAGTLAAQRRPERRVGTLASLQGALVLAAFASGRGAFAQLSPLALGAWAAHLVLALSAAGPLAHFLPVRTGPADPPAPLFRRHPWSGLAASIALLSLAGVPGTPGSLLWLAVARDLAATRHTGLLLALALAWVAAFATAAGEVRRAFGAPTARPVPTGTVPRPARAALWACALGLLALSLDWLAR